MLSYMWVYGGLLERVVRVLDGGAVDVAYGSSIVDDGVVTVAVAATVAKDDGHHGEGDQERALLQ